MIKRKIVTESKYQGRSIKHFTVVDEECLPVFAPAMFLSDLAKNGAALNTTRAYSSDLAQFFNVLRMTKNVEGLSQDYRLITDNHMSGYLYGYLKQNKSLSDKSINRHVATLEQFYTFCYDHGFMLTKPKFSYTYSDNASLNKMDGLTTKMHREYIDEASFKEVILGSIDSKNPFIHERDELALKLGYYAGFRTHELIITENLSAEKLRKALPKQENWRPKSIDLTILGKGNKRRKVPIGVELTDAIYNFLWGRAKGITTTLMSRVNGEPLVNPSYGSDLFSECRNRYLAEINLAEEERIRWAIRSFHILRACFATNAVGLCYKLKLDPRVFVKQWLGHSDYATTEIYVFYDAVLNHRVEVIETLSLEKLEYPIQYRNQKDKVQTNV